MSKAKEDLPEPETPVTTVTALCGMRSAMFFKLFCRAPSMTRSACGDSEGGSDFLVTMLCVLETLAFGLTNHGCTLFTHSSPSGRSPGSSMRQGCDWFEKRCGLQTPEEIAQPDGGQTDEHMQDDIGRGFEHGPVF